MLLQVALLSARRERKGMSTAGPDELLQQVGARVRHYRDELRLNQDDFADRAGMHRAYVGMIENGRKDLRLSTLYRLAEALQVDIRDLLP
ncbi:helix-turn-helix domain-containing protein [Deinococcus arenae]|uniref:helix-turn-helix domain-containing protein n=1 Tax=Deinococcus arenae TaxID=1452751 RepID=UPI00166E07BB|nr:helix-turn-helix transcriptional regulator [Deinococcus arenae]